MKHLIKPLLTALLLLSSIVVCAQDFEVDGIYYNVISEQGKTVEVIKCSKVHNNKLVIPSSVTYEGCTYIVTTIGSFGTIDDCKDITSITIPNSIGSIDNVNFPSIKELIIEDGETALSANYRVIDINPDDRFIEGITGGFPNSIESLYLGRNLSYTRYVNFGMAQKYEYSPCGRCASLKKIVIGDKVTSIGDNLFDGCRKLEEITIGNSVTSIGQNAFYNCINLKAVYISDLAAWCNIYYKTYVSSPFNSNAEYSYACNPLYYADKLYLNGELINKKLTLPDNITVVRDAIFANYASIDSIIIPNNVLQIHTNAFLNNSIKYISIENGTTELLFDYGVPNFTSLETLHIGRQVNPNGGFSNNPSLKNVKISTPYLWSSFIGCSSLINVEFSDNVKTVGIDLFSGCNSLRNVKIPNSVTEIQNGAFSGCKSLEEIILPASLETLDPAFDGCVGLKSITSFIPTNKLFSVVDKYGINAFDGVDKENCILYVPAGAAATYATTDGWKDFKNIVEIKNTYKVTFVVDDKEFVINSISEGDKIIYPEVPQKEGYTFKWDTIINTMPSNDITIKGRYIAQVTLQIPDLDMQYDETKEVSIEMNNEVAIRALQVRVVLPKGITLASAPQLVQERVGSGVDEIGDNVTAQKSLNYNMWADGSYMITVNSDDGLPFAGNKGTVIKFSVKADYFVRGTTQNIELKDIELVNVDGDTNYRPSDSSSLISISCNTVTYKVDGEIYQVLNVPYGATITPIAAPTKEGHTFSGWSEITETMPANDVVIEGSFSVNSYLLTYKVDGDVYASDSIKYGATITSIAAPTKVGHTFSGWSEIPETMPANDVVIEGTFSINSYTVIFMVDGEVYDTMTVEYGATIEPIEAPTKKGHTFSGWSDIPATMPAEDIIVTAQFSVNSYTVSFMVDGAVYKSLTVKYGDSIPAVEVPILDGYIFDSWDEIPSIMPAEDIIIESYWLIPGDVNNDGRISVLDITILTNRILRINDNSIFKQQAADMNSDGRISIVDVTKVTNKILE